MRRKPTSRPQPAGWDKAVKRRLAPEHVERLSDTQVRITLPPCPDFDIEEDEVVEVWIPASALVRSTEPVFAGTFTIQADSFEQRMDNALQGLDDERGLVGERSTLGAFLITFFTCEILAKAVVSQAKYRGTGRKTLSDKWSTKDIAGATEKLGITVERSVIEAVFATTDALASEMSPRDLRDKVTHRMKKVHREAVRTRHAELMRIMDAFIDPVRAWRAAARTRTVENL